MAISVKVKAHTKRNNSQKMPLLIFIPVRQHGNTPKCSLESFKEPIMAQQFSPESEKKLFGKTIVVNNMMINSATFKTDLMTSEVIKWDLT